MIIKTCDRCGNEINTNPMINAVLPSFSISKIENFIIGWRSIDLCPKCEKELDGWLNRKEDGQERDQSDSGVECRKLEDGR